MLLIEVIDVKKYINNRLLFCCRELKLEGRGLYVIKGPNGCGKTTFLRMLFGKDKDFKGAIKNTFESKVMLPQQPYFFKGSVLYNLSLGLKQSGLVKAQEILSRFSISPEAEVNSLSLGQRQLVAFLRAFCINSEVLFLDEPDTYLDDQAKNFMFQLISQHAAKRCIVAVTHDPAIAVSAGTIRFQDGYVKFSTDHDFDITTSLSSKIKFCC
jgi:tungstate transport system ATP-binding protein